MSATEAGSIAPLSSTGSPVPSYPWSSKPPATGASHAATPAVESRSEPVCACVRVVRSRRARTSLMTIEVWVGS